MSDWKKDPLKKYIYLWIWEKKRVDSAFGFISDFNTQDQVQISNIDTDANSKENKVNAADTQSKLESEARPDECNNSLN